MTMTSEHACEVWAETGTCTHGPTFAEVMATMAANWEQLRKAATEPFHSRQGHWDDAYETAPPVPVRESWRYRAWRKITQCAYRFAAWAYRQQCKHTPPGLPLIRRRDGSPY